MAVSGTLTSIAKLFDGATTAFALGAGFQYLDAADLAVAFVDAAGAESAKALGVDFTVTGDGMAGAGVLNVTLLKQAGFVSAIVRRVTERKQNAQIEPNDELPADALEAQLDRQMMVVQEIGDQTDRIESRAVLAAEGETLAPLPAAALRANKLLGFTGAGSVAVSSLTMAQIEQYATAAFTPQYAQLAANVIWQAGAGFTSRSVDSKLAEAAPTLLDMVDEEDRAAVAGGLLAADAAVAALLTAAAGADGLARFTRGSYRITAQTVVPANVSLLLDAGAEIFFDDPGLESGLLIEADGVAIYAERGARIRGPMTYSAGRTGACVIVRGASDVIIDKLATDGGKYGIVAVDNDNLVLRDVMVRNSYNWGFLSAGNRESWWIDCEVDTTLSVSASDCFKVTGKYSDGATVWSTRSSYGLFFVNCFGRYSNAGQVFDIIGTVDEQGDLHDIYLVNPAGIACGSGLLEVKLDEGGGSFAGWPLHDIYVFGGSYQGDGSETTGVYLADRLYNILVDGTRIADTQIGFAIANPARHVQLKDVTAVRCRQEGVWWESGAGAALGCAITSPTVIDANYGQATSIYSAIRFVQGSNIVLSNPTVRRSQEPAGAAHAYGVKIEALASRITFAGAIALSGHATAPLQNLGTNCVFPVTHKCREVAISGDAAGTNVPFGSIQGAFVASSYSVVYSEASNVARTLTIQGRSTSASTTIASFDSSASGVLFQRTQAMIATPVRLDTAKPVLNLNLAPVTLPATPTGKLIVELNGYYDTASLA